MNPITLLHLLLCLSSFKYYSIEMLQERYLSEYNYDEPIDEDRAKRLLNFGDDYRNFIDSLSESYSSISSLSVDKQRKRSKRMRKKSVLVRFIYRGNPQTIVINVIYFSPQAVFTNTSMTPSLKLSVTTCPAYSWTVRGTCPGSPALWTSAAWRASLNPIATTNM